jgi:hypothetical protein
MGHCSKDVSVITPRLVYIGASTDVPPLPCMESAEQDLRGHRAASPTAQTVLILGAVFALPLSRVGRTKGQKSGRKPERRKRGNGCPVANFRSFVLASDRFGAARGGEVQDEG